MEERITKKCRKCGRELPVELFNKCSATKDGHQHLCRECHSAYMKDYYDVEKTSFRSFKRINLLKIEDMKTIIKIVLTYIIAVCVFFPLLAIFNESDNLIVNLGGLAYLLILLYIGTTKVGKKGLKYLIRASYELIKIIGI